MAKKSTIKTLPPDILEKLQELLRDPRMTQLDVTQRINAILTEQCFTKGEPVKQISKSAVNRYAMQMDKVGEKLTQSREIAAMWIGRLGNEPQGQVGALLNELVRNLAFDAAVSMAEGEEPAHPKLIKDLAIGIKELEKAASENEKRSQEMRRQAVQEATNKAAEVAKRSGLSADMIDAFKREMLGVPDA